MVAVGGSGRLVRLPVDFVLVALKRRVIAKVKYIYTPNEFDSLKSKSLKIFTLGMRLELRLNPLSAIPSCKSVLWRSEVRISVVGL
jgi:hypothetical protein